MAFRALIFHQTRISAKEPKEPCVYLSAEFVLLSYWLLYTHTSQPSCCSVKGNLLMQFSHQFCLLYAQMCLSLRGRGVWVRSSTCTYVYPSFCVCACVWAHGGGGVRQHSLLDACLSPYTPPSCSLLPPPGCCSRFSWDGNLQQRLPSPHTRQGNAPT